MAKKEYTRHDSPTSCPPYIYTTALIKLLYKGSLTADTPEMNVRQTVKCIWMDNTKMTY